MNTTAINEDPEGTAAGPGPQASLINLDHPRYGVWLRLLGAFLFLCAGGLSLIYVDLVTRLGLTTAIKLIDGVTGRRHASLLSPDVLCLSGD